MKLALFVFAFISLQNVFAADIDVFSKSSCQGPFLSTEKALDLLGNRDEVNLSKKTVSMSNEGEARFRQALNGKWGKWYPYDFALRMAPVISNNNGQLSLKLYAFYFQESKYELIFTFLKIKCI